MARKTHDIIADVGSYTAPDGQEKKRWLKCGIVLDNGAIKLDGVPISPEWSGWLKMVEPREQRPSPPSFSDSEPPPF